MPSNPTKVPYRIHCQIPMGHQLEWPLRQSWSINHTTHARRLEWPGLVPFPFSPFFFCVHASGLAEWPAVWSEMSVFTNFEPVAPFPSVSGHTILFPSQKCGVIYLSRRPASCSESTTPVVTTSSTLSARVIARILLSMGSGPVSPKPSHCCQVLKAPLLHPSLL